MDARPDGVRRQPARLANLFITKACGFAHQEHIAIKVRQYSEGLIDRQIDILRRQSGTVVDQR